MNISVEHRTTYRYNVPVILEPHIFRLRPRTNSSQRLLTFNLQLNPLPAGTTECLDQDGNLALNAWFNAPTTELSVYSQFTLETLRENPFDYVLLGESLNLPLWYREPTSSALASYRNDNHVTDAVKEYARNSGMKWAVSPGEQTKQDTCKHIPAPCGGHRRSSRAVEEYLS